MGELKKQSQSFAAMRPEYNTTYVIAVAGTKGIGSDGWWIAQLRVWIIGS
jgi:hypothetical protein